MYNDINSYEEFRNISKREKNSTSKLNSTNKLSAF